LVGKARDISHPAALRNYEVLRSFQGIISIIEITDSAAIPAIQADVVIDALLGTGTKGKLRAPISQVVDAINATKGYKIAVDVPELCPRYTGTLIEGIKVGPSPEWMARRLEKCGLRPINNIVDITNYVLLELGHPLHAFDTDQMKGREIVVRKATAEEKILALDGKTYDLTPDMLVVADAERAQAIAGVMGGEISGVTETTKNVILESALFSASSVRRTSKKLNISTDASYRFERGTSWEVAEIASWRALDLILQLAGGAAVARTDLKKSTCVPVTIGLRPERINRVLGIEIPAAEAKEILLSLGMQVVENAGAFRVTVPSWRLDIKQEVDLIHEVIRIKCYENVPVTVMPVLPDLHEGKQAEPVEKEIRLRLRDLGFCEAVNQSFSEVRELERFNMQAVHRIKNPISKENEVLRPSLLPGLWKNLMDNLSQGMDAVRLFESGTAFTAAGEKKRFGMIVTGPVWAANWWKWEGKKIDDTFDFYFLNGIVNVLFAAGQIKITRSDSPASYFHPGKAALIEIDGTVAGEIGMLRPEYTADAQRVTDGLLKAVLLGYLKVRHRAGLIQADLDGVDHIIGILKRFLAVFDAEIGLDGGLAAMVAVDGIKHELGFLQPFGINVVQCDDGIAKSRGQHAVAQHILGKHRGTGAHKRDFCHDESSS
jgi:phenylalanyl-tRNA synthetase beta chain